MKVEVIDGGKAGDHATPKVAKSRDAALKRKALEIVVQLPADHAEALRVLHHAKTLVGVFLADASDV